MKRHVEVVPRNDWRRKAAFFCLFAMAVVTTGCGSSGGRGTPKQPTPAIAVDNWLVDVGGVYTLNADQSVDFNGNTDDLEYFWTALSAFTTVVWQDHCEDVPAEVCVANENDTCFQPQKTECTVNIDCEVGLCNIGKMVCFEKQTTFCASNADCNDGNCNTNSGDSSSDCSEGPCEIGGGQESIISSFVATVPGPYAVRLLVTGKEANAIELQLLNTYPSLYVLGSLFEFGGTLGGLVGASDDADMFAPGALRGVSNPASGNLLLAVPSLSSVREFDFVTNEIIGTFGETGKTTEPVALTFDAGGTLYVANEDGLVQVFDGATGLAAANFGDVTAGAEQVTSLLFEPNGNLLVIDGRPGVGIREYDINTGALLGLFGNSQTVVTQATDAMFFGESPTRLLIADGGGDVISCNANGRMCGSWGSAGAMLQAGGPTSIAANPSGDVNVAAQVLIADAVSEYVLGCDNTGNTCETFGDTTGLASEYYDIFFAPPVLPSTTTTTTTTTMPTNSTSSTSLTTTTLGATTTSSTTTTTGSITSTTVVPASPTTSAR